MAIGYSAPWRVLAGKGLIIPIASPSSLSLVRSVCEAGGLLKHAYFPRGAVLSLLTVLENGSAIETGGRLGRNG